MCFNNNETGDKVETERQVFGSSEEDEFRVEDTAGNANNLIQISQQHPLAPIVKWERYLPVRSLKVLLVENDDSTRHIVTALLKNCSYEVTAASNVLDAWRILEDENSCIDLVLTEVFMPVHSGTGLLCKIMSHKTLKNIPVIMMSSHDSMVLVFKCLSNGAVDFLVKPIRRNELKNLWQHVWRKSHSSSGSGSESRIHNKKSVKTESTEGSENDASLSDEDHWNENGSNSFSNGNGESDNGSGTQSSWTKRAGDDNSTSPSYQLPDANMSPGTCGNRWEYVNKRREVEDQNEQRGTGSQTRMPFCKNDEEPGNIEKDAKYSVEALGRNNDDMLDPSSGNSQVESKRPSRKPEDMKSAEPTQTEPRETGEYRNGDNIPWRCYVRRKKQRTELQRQADDVESSRKQD